MHTRHIPPTGIHRLHRHPSSRREIRLQITIQELVVGLELITETLQDGDFQEAQLDARFLARGAHLGEMRDMRIQKQDEGIAQNAGHIGEIIHRIKAEAESADPL